MRSAATQKYLSVFLLIFFYSGILSAQLFADMSSNLPDDDASFQTKDVFAADIDGDNDLDIILANEFQNNIILLNNGLGVFTRGDVGIPANEEHDSECLAMADFNMDGFEDLIFVSEDDFEHEYYWSSGMGGFITPPLFLPLTSCRAIIAKDFNGDNIPDLMLGNSGQNVMMINDGMGVFDNQTLDRIPFIEDQTQDLAMGDLDGDGDEDIVVANEDGNQLLINDGSGVFQNEAAARFPNNLNLNSRAVLLEDVDNDNDLDVFLCNVQFASGDDPKNRLFLNDGTGHFTDVSEAFLPAYTKQSVDAIFIDFDLDGDADLIINNVLGIPMEAYANNGNGDFEDVSSTVLGAEYAVEAFGIVSGDFNGDNLEDIYVCNQAGKDILLFRNPNINAVNELPLIQAKVFPNPVNEIFQLEAELGTTQWTFSIVDITGQHVLSIKPTSHHAKGASFSKPLSLSKGLYILEGVSKDNKLIASLVMVD